MKYLLYSISFNIFFVPFLFAPPSVSPKLRERIKQKRESFSHDKESLPGKLSEPLQKKKEALNQKLVNEQIENNIAVLTQQRPEKYTVESYQAQEIKIERAIQFLSEKHDDQSYKSIIDEKIKNYKDEKGNTLAHRAFEKLSPDIIEFLVSLELGDLFVLKNKDQKYPAELLESSVDDLFKDYYKGILSRLYINLCMMPTISDKQTGEEQEFFQELISIFLNKYSFVRNEEANLKEEDSDAQQKYFAEQAEQAEQDALRRAEIRRESPKPMTMTEDTEVQKKYFEEQDALRRAEIKRESPQPMTMTEDTLKNIIVDNRPWYQKVIQSFNEMMHVIGETLSVKQAFDILAEEPLEGMSSLACVKQEAKITIAIQTLMQSMISDVSTDQKANEFVMNQIATFKDFETGDNLMHRAFKKGSLAMIAFLMKVNQNLLFKTNNEGLYPIYCLRLPIDDFHNVEIQNQYKSIVTKITEVIDAKNIKKPDDFINKQGLSILVEQLNKRKIFTDEEIQSLKVHTVKQVVEKQNGNFDADQKKSMISEEFYNIDFLNLFSNESINPFTVASYEERESRATRICKFFKKRFRYERAGWYNGVILKNLVNDMRDPETGDNYAHRACKKASPVLIKFLWKHHKDLFYKTNFKHEYPMHLLPLWQTLFLNESLFKKGFLDNPETVDADKKHEYDYMERKVNALNDLVKKILEHKGLGEDAVSLIDSLDQNKNSMLDKAVRDKNEKLVDFLLEKNALIRAHQDGWSLLYEAVSNNNLDMTKKIIDRIDPLLICQQNKKDGGNTPLHKAALIYSFDLLDLLSEKLKAMPGFEKQYFLYKNDAGQTFLDILFLALDKHLITYIQEKDHSLRQITDLFLKNDQGKEKLQELLQTKIENEASLSKGASGLDLVKHSMQASRFEYKAFLSQEQVEAIQQKYKSLLESINSGVK